MSITCQYNACLNSYSTMALTARADKVLLVKDIQELMDYLQDKDSAEHLKVIGSGSNVLFAERVSTTIVLNQTKGVELLEDRKDTVVLRVMGGENWHDFLLYCLDQGYHGLENLALIPGTVGAAPVQNIGAYGSEVADCLLGLNSVDLNTGEQTRFTHEECGFAYRDSIFKSGRAQQHCIVSVDFELSKKFNPKITYPALIQVLPAASADSLSARQLFDAVVGIRRSKLPDPAVLANAGSFFKNPCIDASLAHELKRQFPNIVSFEQDDGSYKLAAAWLIDQCGFRGLHDGSLGMHQNQALVMVNYASASLSEVLDFAAKITDSVKRKFGVALEREPVVVR